MPTFDRRESPESLTLTHERFCTEIDGMDSKSAYKYYKTRRNKVEYQYNTVDTKTEFSLMTGEICSFCGIRIQEYSRSMTIEHIQLKKESPTRIFQWNNLLCSCRNCNTARGVRLYVNNEYINPTIDEYLNYFYFELDGRLIIDCDLPDQEKNRMSYMIKLYKLNRQTLIEERKRDIDFLLNEKIDFLEDQSVKESLRVPWIGEKIQWRKK